MSFIIANLIILWIVGNNIVLFDKYVFLDKVSIRNQVLLSSLFATVLAIAKGLTLSCNNTYIAVLFKAFVYGVTFILILFILKLKFWRAALLLCIAVISMSAGECIILLLFTFLKIDIGAVVSGDNLALYFIGNLFINLFQMMILQIIKIKKTTVTLARSMKNKTYRHIILNLASAIVVMTITMFIICFDRQRVVIASIYGVLAAFVVICNMMSIRTVIQVDFRDEKLKIQEGYNEILIELKHKFLGMISILTALIEDGDTKALKEYVNELNNGLVERIRNMPTSIKNTKVFYLIAVKTGEANDIGVSFRVIIPYEIAEITGIKEQDFIYVLNELLSNAIENASKSKDKQVYLKIENLNDYIKIVIENSIIDDISNKKMQILHNEGNKQGRGHGLKQVRKLLGDNTYFKLSITDRFTVELIINKI